MVLSSFPRYLNTTSQNDYHIIIDQSILYLVAGTTEFKNNDRQMKEYTAKIKHAFQEYNINIY